MYKEYINYYGGRIILVVNVFDNLRSTYNKYKKKKCETKCVLT